MAIGKASDFVIYQEEFFGGMSETLTQETEIFNSASNNCIRLVPAALKGDYNKESFITSIGNLVTPRDTTSIADATQLIASQLEYIGVKVARKIGPVANTLDSWRKIGADASEMSFLLGQQWGKAVAVDYVDVACGAAANALENVAALKHDGTAGVISHASLNSALAKFGDAANNIDCLVMHSKVYFDLIDASITANVFGVGGVSIVEGTVATFGRPVIITDSSGLIDTSGASDVYTTLGLVQNGIVIQESESREIVSDTVTGLENLVMRIQGEYAFNLNIKGFQWDIANGAANPNAAALNLGTNWDQKAADVKSCAGVALTTD
jgi:hypothetical protein